MFTQQSHLSFFGLTRVLVACSMLLMCAHTQAQSAPNPTGALPGRTQGNPPPTKQSSDPGNDVLNAVGAAAAIGVGAIILNKVFGKKDEPAKPAAPPVPVAPPTPTASAPVVWIGAAKSPLVVQPPSAQPPAQKTNQQLAQLRAQLEEAQARIKQLTKDKADATNALESNNAKLADAQNKLNEQATATSTVEQRLKDAQASTAAAEQRVVALRKQQEAFEQRAWWLAALAVVVLFGLGAALVRALWYLKPKLVTVSVSPDTWSLHAEQAHAEPKGCFKIHTEWQAVRALVQKYEPNSLPEQAILKTA